MFAVAATVRWCPGALQLYKWLDSQANYAPDSPWYSRARFGDGTYKTIYLAHTAEGAIAEYLRRHPEFLNFQDDLRLVLYELDLSVNGECVDVRTPAGQSQVGIATDRLTSSEDDEDVRYVECRQLAAEVVAAGLTGIAYPAAAVTSGAWNVVLFGDQSANTWTATSYREVSRPRVDPRAVRVLR